MTVSRLTALTLLAAAGFALLPRSAAVAQDKEPPLPSKSTASFTRVNEYKSDPRKVSGELAQAKDHMKAFAKYYADFLAHPLVYRVIQDPAKLPQGVLLSSLNIDEKIAEMGRYLAEPQPNNRSAADSSQVRYNSDYADFIRELGAALDESLMKLVREHPERIVRVNAMRAYIVACKTGAAPHWPTVTNLLKDPKTRPEIKILALQAAANLFAAYDPDDYPSRRHAIGSKRPRIDADKEIGTLVKAVQDCVTTPKMLLADYPDGIGPKKSASPGQVEVLRYARREAIRALAKVRFVKLPGPGGDDDPLYPAFTLARVCMADPALGPTPTPSESAEAVLGLANMAPVWNGKPVEN
ncbi:MAG TPA: hypothetical protein VM529_12750, partial [Gemmata sp.]|nr:hypothetical protein [Gemmata sp.]